MGKVIIWWRGPTGVIEQIDKAESEESAQYLVREYKLAYDTQNIWYGRKADEPEWSKLYGIKMGRKVS